jgi:ribosomal protein uS2
MERYTYKRRADGIWVIDLEKTYEKLQMAARAIVAIENPQDVMVQSARPYGQRAVFKFAQYLNCKYSAGRHTPGTFTNQIQKNFEEPRLLLLTDPRCVACIGSRDKFDQTEAAAGRDEGNAGGRWRCRRLQTGGRNALDGC